MTDDELEQLQSYAFRWWIDYRLSLQFKVADVIHSAINLARLNDDDDVEDEPSPDNATLPGYEVMKEELQRNWIAAMRAVKDSASSLSKPNLNVVWNTKLHLTSEWAVIHDTNLAFVDANIK